MIAASEPLEFIPRGRQAVEEHPGPVSVKQPSSTSRNVSGANESMLMHRMQSVNLSMDENTPPVFHESWLMDEVYCGADWMTDVTANSDHELYYKGYTAVWTQGVSADNVVLPRTCFTCETPIKHAFFCPPEFVREKPLGKPVEPPANVTVGSSAHEIPGVCLIDSMAMHVYLSNGEHFLTSLEFAVSQVWTTRFGVLLEKTASSAQIHTQSIAMPRLFSLSHPLDEMCPVLVRPLIGSVAYLTEADYQVVFTSSQSSLVLMYDNKLSKHFVSRLRPTTAEETNTIGANDTLQTDIMGCSNSMQGASILKFLGTSNKQNRSQNTFAPKPTPFSNNNRTQSPFPSRHFNVSQPNNVSGTGVRGVNVAAPSAHSFSQRSFANSPRDRLQTTFGSGTLAGGSLGPSGGMASMHSLGGEHRMDAGRVGLAAGPPLAKPIAPELCLEYLWIDNSTSKEYSEIASHSFLHTDLVGRRFLGFMLKRSGKLQLIRLDGADKVHKKGLVASIPARDAVVLQQMNLMALLDVCGTLLLYSGTVLIGKVHVGGVLSSTANMSTSFGTPAFPRRSSLLPTINADARFDDELHTLSPVHPLQPHVLSRNSGFCSSLRDPAGNRLTLVYPGGRMYRVAMPPIAECPLVTKCLHVLQAVLPSTLALQVLVKWYGTRNAPGTHDMNPMHEWTMLCAVIVELIGRPVTNAAQPTQPHNASHDSSSMSSQSDAEPKKRRKSESCPGSDDDWEFLMNYVDRSSARRPTSQDASCTPFARYNCSAPLFDKMPLVFYALHLFYEDRKLFGGVGQLQMRSLGELLYQLSMDLQLDCYSLHYFLDQPTLIYVQSASILTDADTKLLSHLSLLGGQVPHLFKYMHGIVTEQANGGARYPHVSNVNDRSRQILMLAHLIHAGENPHMQTLTSCVQTLQLVQRSGRQSDDPPTISDDFDRLANSGKTLNQRVIDALLAMQITRRDIEHLPLALQILLVDFLEGCRTDVLVDRSDPAVCQLLLRADLLAHARFEPNETKRPKPNRTFRNVQREHSLSPRVPATPDVIPRSDGATLGDDGMDQMDTKLLQLRFPDDLRIAEVRRVLSSSRPVDIDIVQSLGVSDHDFIEEQERQLFAICTRTMALPMGRAMFSMRTLTPVSTESLSLPKLCLSGRETAKGATVELQQIEVPANMNQWPLYHNGVAAGLQITTDARDVDSPWIVYNKSKVQTEGSAEHGGFLMALGLNGHLKSLAFMSVYDYLVKIDDMTSIGLLLGIAAAHCGTQDMTTTKLMSLHLEALLPSTALELDISQNVQVACIMGIGLVYRGTAKRHMAEVLLQEIGRPPGPEMENCVERESYALTAGLALGLVTLGQGESPPGLRDLQLPDTLHYYMIGGKRRTLCGAQRDKYKLPSFQVREGDAVNIDVTAPGATLALGLMFFATGNAAVANWMRPPETSYLLDLVRPDLLLLRSIARGLIMWSDVRADDAWLWAQFPEALRFDAAVGPVDTDDMDVDHEANCQAYCNILAGAAMCIGLKYAGTEDAVVFVRLRRILDLFMNVNGKYIGLYAGKATIESCLVLVLLALSLVYAGSGNIEILRICRMLRARLGASAYQHVTYGSQMAIHMSIGFLFLGAGRFTLLRTPEAIAALVCALFPKFPTHSNDNRYHLQAFRHLYVLAVQPRILLPRDIDSGKLCLCNLTYVKLDAPSSAVTAMAPCMLPELHSLQSVEINDPNYWPIRFERGKNWNVLDAILSKSGCVDIQQKAGCLSHLDDPDRLKSLLAQTLTTEQYSCWTIEPKTLLSFSSDAKVQNFMRIFLEPHGNATESQPAASKTELEVQQQIMLQFYQCLTQDRMHALPIYLNLLLMLRRNLTQPSTADVWQLKIITAMLHRQRTGVQLLSNEIVGSLLKRFAVRMDDAAQNHRAQLKQFLFATSCGFLMHYEPAKLAHVAALITFYDLPLGGMSLLQSSNVAQLNYLKLMLALSPLRLSTATMRCIAQCMESV